MKWRCSLCDPSVWHASTDPGADLHAHYLEHHWRVAT